MPRVRNILDADNRLEVGNVDHSSQTATTDNRIVHVSFLGMANKSLTEVHPQLRSPTEYATIKTDPVVTRDKSISTASCRRTLRLRKAETGGYLPSAVVEADADTVELYILDVNLNSAILRPICRRLVVSP